MKIRDWSGKIRKRNRMDKTAGEKNGQETERKTKGRMREKVQERIWVKAPLKWSMIMLITLCWLLPLAVIAYIMFYVAADKINLQTERTIVTSADNAIKICEMRMDAAVEASRVASYLPTVKECYAEYQKDGNLLELRKKLNLFLEQNYCYNDSFSFTSLFFTDNPKEQYFTAYRGATSNAVYQASRRFADKVMPQVLEIYPKLDTDVAIINVEGRIYLVRNLMTPAYHPYAVLTIELNKEVVFGSLESTWGYVGSAIYMDNVYLTGDNDQMLAGKPEISTELFGENNRECRLMKKGKEYYAYAVRKPDRHYVGYIIALDRQAVIDGAYVVKYISIILILFMIPLIIIVFIFFSRKVTRPIGSLVQASHAIEEGNFGYQIEKNANSQEFEYLEEAFNHMSSRLQYQIDKIYTEELALKDARIMALQSQINPHFLNNALEIINWEARINENYKVSRMIENLSVMLEATMDRRHRRFVTLAEEMSYVEAYLFIISQRLGERMQVEKDVDESLFGMKVPRLIIQPIIENAVEHGINGQTEGRIAICIFREKERLVIEVRNTGLMTEADKEKIGILLSDGYEPGEFGSASLGIRNVNRRIKIIYGENYGLTVSNAADGETVSRITVRADGEELP
ncbi:MAG TPA: hypothetical protein DCZ40_05785 [Lachnospiraceae bacterium]|nr:hypothetical protein [Lachnospiraceae bacterium]